MFVDNQGFSPLCLVRKHVETEGSSAGVWTWSERLVPEAIRSNETAVMACQSTRRRGRPTTPSASVRYRLQSQHATRFWALLRLAGDAATANQELQRALAEDRPTAEEVEEQAIGSLFDALAEACSNAKVGVVVRREQVEVRCRHAPEGSGQTTGWIGYSGDGRTRWRPALAAEEMAATKAQTEPEPEPEPDSEPAAESEAEADEEAGQEAEAPAPAPEPEPTPEWQAKPLADLPGLSLFHDSPGEGTGMALAFIVTDGAASAILSAAATNAAAAAHRAQQAVAREEGAEEETEEESVVGERSTWPPLPTESSELLAPSLGAQLGDCLYRYGPAWLLFAGAGGTDPSRLAAEVEPLPGSNAPGPQSCEVEMSWSHLGTTARAKWAVTPATAGQSYGATVQVTGCGQGKAPKTDADGTTEQEFQRYEQRSFLLLLH